MECRGFVTSGWRSRGPEYKPEEGDVLARQHCPAVQRVPSEDTNKIIYRGSESNFVHIIIDILFVKCNIDQ